MTTFKRRIIQITTFKQGRSYHWGLGGPRPPHQSVWPPPTNDLGYCKFTVQFNSYS